MPLQIETTAVRISKMVAGLKSFIRSAEHDPFETLTVKALFADATELCRDRFYHGDIDLQVQAPRPDLSLECRPAQVLQVLVNLLNNAFDAIQSNTEKWVRLGVEDAGDELVISVTDSGKGIPSETANKLFKRFFTTKPPGKGTGPGPEPFP